MLNYGPMTVLIFVFANKLAASFPESLILIQLHFALQFRSFLAAIRISKKIFKFEPLTGRLT